jgi:hypothetical protein
MPDESGASLASSDPAASTPLHAYKDGRSEDVVGDPTAQDIVAESPESREDPDKHDPDDAANA